MSGMDLKDAGRYAFLALLVRRKRAAPRPAGRTCGCCTSTVYDPVEVR